MDLSCITPAFKTFVDRYIDNTIQSLYIVLDMYRSSVSLMKSSDNGVEIYSRTEEATTSIVDMLEDVFCVRLRIVDMQTFISVQLGNGALGRYIHRQVMLLNKVIDWFDRYEKVLSSVQHQYPSTSLQIISDGRTIQFSSLNPECPEYNYARALHDYYCSFGTSHPVASLVRHRTRPIYSVTDHGLSVCTASYKVVPFRMKVEIILQAGKKRRNRIQAQNVHVLRPILPLELRNLIGSFLSRPCS